MELITAWGGRGTGLRNLNGKSQTAIVLYEEPNTARRIVIITTIHLAEEPYFERLQKVIDQLSNQGYRILYEGVRPLSPEERKTLTPKEKTVWSDFAYLFKTIDALGIVLGLQHQKKGLSYPASWVRTDVNLLDLIRVCAERDASPISGRKVKTSVFKDETNRLLTRWLFNKLLGQLIFLEVANYALELSSRKIREAKKIIVDFRNQHAIQEITKDSYQRNVVYICGASHLKGIDKHLRKLGFQEIKRRWLTAYHVRNYPLGEVLRALTASFD